MKQVQCPNCGASMEIDESREFAFCIYCGTKIIVKETINIDRNNEINNLLTRAYEYEEKHDYVKARDYCDRILDIDAKNHYARALEERLNKVSPKNNVRIKYVSYLKDKFKLRVTLDGFTWLTIEPNEEISLQIPCGTRNILFAGRKTYKKKVVISDPSKVILITYTANSRFDNEITIKE